MITYDHTFMIHKFFSNWKISSSVLRFFLILINTVKIIILV